VDQGLGAKAPHQMNIINNDDMKKYEITAAILTTFSMFGLTSCVEDEGNYDLTEPNEVAISNIKDEYNLLSYVETLEITPTLECSDKNTAEDDLEYKWFVCSGSTTLNSHEHEVISTERNLSYKVNVPPGSYRIYCQVKDKNTGLKFEKSFTLNAISSFVRGFYLYGDKADGTVGMDFVSMPEGRDTLLIKDIFTNKQGIKGAKNLVFTGHYNDYSALWAITDDSQYALEYSAQLEKVDVIENKTLDNLLFPSVKTVKRPFHLANIWPGTYGPACICLSRTTRCMVTDNEVFSASLYTGEGYGDPLNRYEQTTTADLFKPYPEAFYSAQQNNVSWLVFFDMTNHCFVKPTGSSMLSYCRYSAKFEDSASPFYLDQTNYTPVRQMVYGENGYGNSGRSYALMTDANDDYYVYGFTAPSSYRLNITKHFAKKINFNVATDFAQASHYAFFSMQSVILYSVGNKLYAYDYAREDCKLIADYDAEVTYLAMEHHSTLEPTDFIVATYSEAKKGTVMKYTIADDVNAIKVTLHEHEVWNTDLKVVKVVWKYSIK